MGYCRIPANVGDGHEKGRHQAMVRKGARWRPRGYRDGIKSAVMRMTRLIHMNVGQRRDRREPEGTIPRLQFCLVIGTVLFDAAWLAVWCLVATRYYSAVAIVLASLPVLKWLLMLIARHPAGTARTEQPPALAAAAPCAVDNSKEGCLDFGWARLGDAHEAFRFETDRLRHGLSTDPVQRARSEQDFPRGQTSVLTEPGPMV
jgi:hypothetical protein